MKFIIEDQALKKLSGNFENAGRKILDAIKEKRPVWIRHHADADGYSGAISLQKAILPIIINEHYDKTAAYKYYKRLPSKTPFYNEEDATKDIINSLENKEKFRNNLPLIIIIDNGSTEEDVFALKKLKALGFPIVVIDHHDPGENNAEAFIDSHINPHNAIKGNPSELTAGMLCVELARQLDDSLCDAHIAAISGIADKSEKEPYKQYLALSKKEGFDEEYLRQLSLAIDHEAYLVRFQEGRQYFSILFGERNKEQENLANIISDIAHKKKEEQALVARKIAKIEDKGRIIVAKIYTEGMTNREAYPTIGKIAGMIRDWLEKEKRKTTIAISIDKGKISFRMSKDAPFDVNKITEELKKELPESLITGGGHAHAGSLRFNEIDKEKILRKIDHMLT